jgi:septum formation protein
MMRLILASGSKARQQMLRDAGVAFEVIPANIDEGKLLQQMVQQKSSPETVAAALAQAKALAVAQQNPGVLVIGGDQVLWFGGRIYSKAKTVTEARGNLKSFSGKPHRLISAVCMARDGAILWEHADHADMHVRQMDDALLDDYMSRAGDALLETVGGYELEGAGKDLFEKVDGDFYTVLGMPLKPLLEFLKGVT